MKKLNLSTMLNDLSQVVVRFYLVLIFVIGLATMSFLEVNFKWFEEEFNVWAFFILGIVSMISVTLLNTNIKSLFLKIANVVLTIVAIGIYTFYFYNNKIEWENQQFAIVLISLILSLFFVLFFKKKTDASFWLFAGENTREAITTAIYSGVLYGGLALAIFAVKELFAVHIPDKTYANLAIICYQLIAPVYFLMNITPKDNFYKSEIDYHKFLKILGLYILLPVLGLYVVILYAYLVKIVVIWELPNGWVTTLVSVLALGGYLAKFFLFPIADHKIVRFLNKYFSLIILPLVVLMSVGLNRRISDYGFSINRLYVLVFNVWLYGVSIYLFITESKHLRWLVISFVFVAFIVSVGPWSVFAITQKSIEKDVRTLLIENKLFVNEKLVLNKNNKMQINDSVGTIISDKVYYMINSFGIDNWKKKFNDKRKITSAYMVVEALGVNDINLNKTERNLYAALGSEKKYPVIGYTAYLNDMSMKADSNSIYKDNHINISINKNIISVNNKLTGYTDNYNLTPMLKQIYLNEENDSLFNKILVQKSDNSLLLINNINAQCKSDEEFTIKHLNISVFVK